MSKHPSYSVILVATLSLLGLSGCHLFVAAAAGFAGANAAEERTLGKAIDDSTIHAEITGFYIQTDAKDMLVNVTARVHEGRVMLTGTVNREETAREAVRLAWAAKGVKEVINNLEVSDKSNIMNDANDTWIETQIESRLLATKGIKSLNYTVEVENGVAYLLGVAQNEQELKNVAYIASITKGVTKVVSYVRPVDNEA
jgi:osmotically-inducible protein OsmY